MNWAGVLGTPVVPLESGTPKVMDLPAFDGYSDPKKLDVISSIAENAGRDPQLATVAVSIFREYNVQPRDYRGQADALLRWVQRNIYYVNEPDERLQDPFYTLKVKYGDCDDLAILVYSLARSVRLPAKLVISGTTKSGKKVRYHHGDRNFDRSVNWSHIYLMLGDRPYGEPKWFYAEPTLNVPLGWDVVSQSGDVLPEMSNRASYGDPNMFRSRSFGASIPYYPMPTVPAGRRPYIPPGLFKKLHTEPLPYLSAEEYAARPELYNQTPAPLPPPGVYNLPGVPAPLDAGYYPAPMPVPAPDAPSQPVVPPGLSSEAPGFRMGSDGESANAVAVLLVDRGGQILLLHRAPSQAFMGGAWDLPGGKADPRYSARDQAAKALFEETGLKLPSAALRPLVTAYHPNTGTAIFYSAEVTGEMARAIKVNAPEHVEFRWVGPDEGAADMKLVPYMPLVLDALRKSRGGMMPTQAGGYGVDDGSSVVTYGVGYLLAAGLAGYLLGQWQLKRMYR